ncbi:hypothetical protein VP01_1162g2 [Puccinia sorghi]|uniref:Uncharacterized protein n=1 Tax=Puccinia sorghi TaxID=27349 RepID=A0A0L6VRF2_9BASI|nr:hypothetical protein VP01_1162g2 [Puccinia sorghi]
MNLTHHATGLPWRISSVVGAMFEKEHAHYQKNRVLADQKNCVTLSNTRHQWTSPPSSAVLWYHRLQQGRDETATIYHRAPRVSFKRLPRWEPWYDERIPERLFLKSRLACIN